MGLFNLQNYEKQFLNLIDYNEARVNSVKKKLGINDTGVAQDFANLLKKLDEAMGENIKDAKEAINSNVSEAAKLYGKISTDELEGICNSIKSDFDIYTKCTNECDSLVTEIGSIKDEITDLENKNNSLKNNKKIAVNKTKIKNLESQKTELNKDLESKKGIIEKKVESIEENVKKAKAEFNNVNSNYKEYQKYVTNNLLSLFITDGKNNDKVSETVDNRVIYNGIINYLQNNDTLKFTNKVGKLKIDTSGNLIFQFGTFNKTTNEFKNESLDLYNSGPYGKDYSFNYNTSKDYTSDIGEFVSDNTKVTIISNCTEADLAIERYLFTIKRYTDEVLRHINYINDIKNKLYGTGSIGEIINNLYIKLCQKKDEAEKETDFTNALNKASILSAAAATNTKETYTEYLNNEGTVGHEETEKIAKATYDFYFDLVYHMNGNPFSSSASELEERAKEYSVSSNLFFNAVSDLSTYIERDKNTTANKTDIYIPTSFKLVFSSFQDSDGKFIENETVGVGESENIKISSMNSYLLTECASENIKKESIEGYYVAAGITEINEKLASREDAATKLGKFYDPIKKYYDCLNYNVKEYEVNI